MKCNNCTLINDKHRNIADAFACKSMLRRIISQAENVDSDLTLFTFTSNFSEC